MNLETKITIYNFTPSGFYVDPKIIGISTWVYLFLTIFASNAFGNVRYSF